MRNMKLDQRKSCFSGQNVGSVKPMCQSELQWPTDESSMIQITQELLARGSDNKFYIGSHVNLNKLCKKTSIVRVQRKPY